MSPLLRLVASVVVTVNLAGALAACSRNTDASSSVAAAPGASVAESAAPATPRAFSADPTKTGQAYVEELEHNPTLFEKQKQICNGHGADSQPSPELEGPCAAWDTARSNLEVDQQLHQGGVKNTDSL